jgi:hypothetical protein
MMKIQKNNNLCHISQKNREKNHKRQQRQNMLSNIANTRVEILQLIWSIVLTNIKILILFHQIQTKVSEKSPNPPLFKK